MECVAKTPTKSDDVRARCRERGWRARNRARAQVRECAMVLGYVVAANQNKNQWRWSPLYHQRTQPIHGDIHAVCVVVCVARCAGKVCAKDMRSRRESGEGKGLLSLSPPPPPPEQQTPSLPTNPTAVQCVQKWWRKGDCVGAGEAAVCVGTTTSSSSSSRW